ncbi:hypothetical protein [Pendulispora albinea]|uniref:Porin n=1 Tax=Pendulispora albinea TaxID=2741071 RepID=A0ABZ2M6M5_9BACT
MPQTRSLFSSLVMAGLVSLGAVPAAFAQTTPGSPTNQPNPQSPSTNPPGDHPTPLPAPAPSNGGNGKAGTSLEAPISGEASTSARPGAPTPVNPPPAADEGDDLSMTFHSSRTTDMQQFAEGSMNEIHIGTAKPRFALNLFGDVSFGIANRDEGNAKSEPAFAAGVFDLLFNGDLDGKILATSEVTFQYDASAPLASLERLHIRWKPTKSFFVEVGRFHTDIGYWNVAYHHGKWLQLTIERPRTILLHGGLLPVHWMGLQSGVSAPVGKATLSLVGSIGSSRDPLPDSAPGAAHNSHGTAFTPVNGGHAKLELAGLGHSDLRVGVSGVYTRIRGEISALRAGLPDTPMDEFIGNAYIAFPSVPFNFIAEGYVIEHRVSSGAQSSGLAGAKWRTYAAFAVAGYTFGRITPYIKGEYVTNKKNVSQADPYYIPKPKVPTPPDVTMDLVEGTIGARIDTSTWSALKLEYRITGGIGQRREYDELDQKLNNPIIHTWTANWSFGI